MAPVALRPSANLFQAVDERGGVRPEIDVGNVQHLQPRLVELTGSHQDQGRRPCPARARSCERTGIEQRSPGIGEYIELDLANTLPRKLLRQGAVGVIERLGPAATRRRNHLHDGRVARCGTSCDYQ